MPVAVREKMLKLTPSPRTVAPMGALCPGPTPFCRRSNRLVAKLLISSGVPARRKHADQHRYHRNQVNLSSHSFDDYDGARCGEDRIDVAEAKRGDGSKTEV